MPVYDWVMQGIKNVDLSGKLIKKIGSERVLCAETKEEADFALTKIPAFGWVSNKMFKLSIIQQHNLQFVTTSSINEDRVFNLEYSQYIYSFLMLPSVSYNYVENPKSLTHSYVHPNMFINTAKEYDKILRNGKLGLHLSVYTGKFCIRFYIHAIGLCIVSPFTKLSLLKRSSLFMVTFKSLFSSYAIHQYKLRVVKWGMKDFYVYARKFLMRK